MRRTRKPAVPSRFGIGTKISALISLCALTAITGAWLLLAQMQVTVDRQERALTSLMGGIDLARQMQVDFKKQVQEWKDILLRGHDSTDLETYRTQFFRQEQRVLEDGQALSRRLDQSRARALLGGFLQAHRSLGQRYRSALDVFARSGGSDYRSADRIVRGADRPPTDLIDTIVASLERELEEYKAQHAAELARERRATALAVACIFLMLLAIGLVLARQIVTPIRNLTRTMSRVSVEKDYSLRAARCSRDELGLLTDGFNEMLSRIQRQSAELNETRQDLEGRVVQRTQELQREAAERKRAEEDLRKLNADLERRVEERTAQLRRSQRELADFFENATEGLHWVGPDGRIQWVNQAELDVLGYTREEYEGHHISEFHVDQEVIDDILSRLVAGEALYNYEARLRCKDGSIRTVLINSNTLVEDGKLLHTRCFTRDVTERKCAEEQLRRVNEELERRVLERTQQLEDVHRQLREAYREAGMAEVATNVLHNVGNVLNSVNVSANLVAQQAENSKAGGLAAVVALLRAHEHDLAQFITADARGRHLVPHLGNLAEHLRAEQAAMIQEIVSLRANVGHIKDIVMMQQSYAKVSGIKEIISVEDLVEDCLRMKSGALIQHRVELVRDFQDRPTVNLDKHKVLQILVNLMRNAKYACSESQHPERRVTVRVATEEDRVRISVIDNGVGIAAENLTRIFTHGFTTRASGHGFGLHSGALAAKELGGSLTVHSEGLGRGATFTLELPLHRAQALSEQQTACA